METKFNSSSRDEKKSFQIITPHGDGNDNTAREWLIAVKFSNHYPSRGWKLSARNDNHRHQYAVFKSLPLTGMKIIEHQHKKGADISAADMVTSVGLSRDKAVTLTPIQLPPSIKTLARMADLFVGFAPGELSLW